MLNERVKRIIEDSGFIVWEDEPWGPGKLDIDWSCDYTKEMETFVKSLLEEIIADIQCYSSLSIEGSSPHVESVEDIAYNQAIEHAVDHIRRNFLKSE